MKQVVYGMIVVLALAGALTLSAQTPQASPAGQSAPAVAAGQAAPAAPAQTADDIVGKYVAAVGGKDAIGQVKSISMETAVQVMGSDAPSTTVILDGVGYKTEMNINGAKIVQCYTDKGGWSVNPMAGTADPTPMTDDEYSVGKDQIYVGGELYNYAGKGSTVELMGKDADSYKLKLTSKEKRETVYVIDGTTYLIKSVTRKSKVQGQDVQVTTSFSDYRKADVGYSFPYAMNVDFGGQFSLAIAVKKVELNKTIDPAIFVMPKAAPAASAQ